MTREEKMNYLRLRDNLQETDENLSAALDVAKYAIMTRAFPFEHDLDNIEFPKCYDMLQVDIANVLIKKSGVEGETVHMENGIHRHYESADIPTSMLTVITPKVGVIK